MKRISWKLTERHRQTQPHLLERPQLWSILSSSSADLIINGRFVTTKIKQQVCITTNGDDICAHIINPETWKPQIFDSINWDYVATAMAKEFNANKTFIIKFYHGLLSTQRNMKYYHLSTTSNFFIWQFHPKTHCHLLCCKHAHYKSNIRIQLQQAHKYMSHYNYLPVIWETVSQNILNGLG